MIKYNKYARNRRKSLRLIFIFTAIVVLLRLMSESRSYVLSVVVVILICSPFWIVFSRVIFKFRKQIRRSNALYNGTLEEVLENCSDCTEEYALIDRGIFNFSSGRLSLYGDITCLTPREIATAYQLWIYEQNELSSYVFFDKKEELDGFLEKIRFTHPEINIWEQEGMPSKEELDKIVRREFGGKAADRLGIAKMTDSEYAELTEGKQVDDSTGPLADKDKLRF